MGRSWAWHTPNERSTTSRGRPMGIWRSLAVAAEAEGRRVGRALLSAVERWAVGEGDRFVTLNVFATNARAIGVYERAGYQPDTVRYVKTLQSPP